MMISKNNLLYRPADAYHNVSCDNLLKFYFSTALYKILIIPMSLPGFDQEHFYNFKWNTAIYRVNVINFYSVVYLFFVHLAISA